MMGFDLAAPGWGPWASAAAFALVGVAAGRLDVLAYRRQGGPAG